MPTKVEASMTGFDGTNKELVATSGEASVLLKWGEDGSVRGAESASIQMNADRPLARAVSEPRNQCCLVLPDDGSVEG